MADLEELAGRVEALAGPSIEMDAEIALATGRLPDGAVVKGAMYSFTASNGERACSFLPRYTASIDAAMKLVPEGHKLLLAENLDDARWRATLSYREGESEPWTHPFRFSASPALALTAAALRARSRTQGNQNG